MSFAFDLPSVWFLLVGVLFMGYAVLDGFDLGVGALHLFSRTDTERRIMINSIGPVWDGNEVWLVTAGGALFAAFPEVYATVFSGFYLAFMLFVFSLIFRAVAIEFRSKQPMAWWRGAWDVSFSVASVVGSLLVGVALGNIARGIPLAADHEYAGTFLGLLNPYALLVGVTTVALFAMHGNIYVLLKTEGALRERAQRWVRWTIALFVTCYVTTTLVTLLTQPHMVRPYLRQPLFALVPFATLLAVANIPREVVHGRELRALLSSAAAMMGLLALFGIGMYPHIVYSPVDPAHSLLVYNAASSTRTLTLMLIIAGIGMPLVLGYTVAIYRIFRGKVKLTENSY
jgi:cytochrome d ubiquinol oxidase subunit II